MSRPPTPVQTSPKEGLGSGELPKSWSVGYVLPETSRHTTNAHPTTPRSSPEDQGYALDVFEFSDHESEDPPHQAFRISMITSPSRHITNGPPRPPPRAGKPTQGARHPSMYKSGPPRIGGSNHRRRFSSPRRETVAGAFKMSWDLTETKRLEMLLHGTRSPYWHLECTHESKRSQRTQHLEAHKQSLRFETAFQGRKPS